VVRIRGWNSFQKQIHAIEIDDGVANVQRVHAEGSGADGCVVAAGLQGIKGLVPFCDVFAGIAAIGWRRRQERYRGW